MTDAAVYTGRASIRGGILVTGTEVLTGIISDRNGPWVSERLLALGVDPAIIAIVGDRPEDLRAALAHMADEGVRVIVTSGGLGPTADDLTAEIVGEFCGREMVLDEQLEEVISEIVSSLRTRFPDVDQEALRIANRKQAVIPEGATVIQPRGTAPGLVVLPADGRSGPTVVVLPGPPSELTQMWDEAVATEAFRAAVTGAPEYRREIVRLFGLPESEIANTLRAADAAGISLEHLEITTCLRRGELEIATRFEPEAEADYEALFSFIAERHQRELFSTDGSTIDEQVAALLAGETIGLAESCTAGLLAARLTERPGSSAYVLGGAVVYSNEAKSDLVAVPADLIREHGAVSGEVALALADGARRRFRATVGVGVTGIAGPDGGSPEKPVGFVCFSVSYGASGGEGEPLRTLTRSTRLPGDRGAVRERSTTVAMHLIARILRGESD